MFAALGHLTYSRRRSVLALAAAVVVLAVTWGTGVFGRLANGGFEDERSESARARQLADAALGRDDADVIALYRSTERTVDDPGFRAVVEGALAALPRSAVAGATTYWNTGAPQLVSADRRATYVVLRLVGDNDDARMTSYEAIEHRLAVPGLTLQLGGQVPVNVAINHQVEQDIARAELLSMPVVLVLLVIVFGGVVAAGLPLVVGALAVLGAFTILRLLTLVTDISVFAINIITMLGLGLAIDYALFVVNRFREELSRDANVEEALVRTLRTAGRTVAFSGVTVMVSLASLLLFPQSFLRSMGLGGMAAVLVAMLGALTVLPAQLAVLGPRVNAWRVPLPLIHGRGGDRTGDAGSWARVAHAVMRRPAVIAVAIVVVLVALGTPFLRIAFGGVDARVLPAGTESRVVEETLRRDFPAGNTAPIEAVVRGGDRAGVAGYVDALRAVPGVTGAQVTGAANDVTRVTISYAGLPTSDEAQQTVRAVRAVPAPAGAEVLVDGETAMLVDLLDGLGQVLPWMAVFVGVATFVLLFLAFGSVVLPVKAIVMNVLSLSATFGAIVWVFQDGHLSGLLGFTPTGTIEATQPILILAIAFGLSMDYEVFLLSRVREQWDRTRDNAAAVATGLQRTGRIITSAALLLVVVFAGFATSGITFIKMIGIGMMIAIVVDATIVRVLLVPATMRLLGAANWWAPRPLARLYDRIGVRESDGADLHQPVAVPAPRVPASTVVG